MSSLDGNARKTKTGAPWGGAPIKAGRRNIQGGEVMKNESIISLDDQNFGKF
jgi:hypothetical protein